MPNGDHEPIVLSRLCALVAAFERQNGHWPSAVKLGREGRDELRQFLGPATFSRLLDRLAPLPDDDAPRCDSTVLVRDPQGVTLEYRNVEARVAVDRARLWLGIDREAPDRWTAHTPEHTDLEWDFVTDPEVLKEDAQQARGALANSARAGDWDSVFALLHQTPTWVNAARPGGTSGFTPLHQAAYLGAPDAVVCRLLEMGAWRILRAANGELPVDIASRRAHGHLVGLLTPRPLAPVEPRDLQAMEAYFHGAINARAADLVREHRLRLPSLEPLQELPMRGVWMPVPGMYGGFHYWLVRGAPDPLLVTDSWSRVVGGSGQRHEVTPDGVRLTAEGSAWP